MLLGHRQLAASLLKGLAWNLQQLPARLTQAGRPGVSTMSWLKGRVTLVPAAWSNVRNDGFPRFVKE